MSDIRDCGLYKEKIMQVFFASNDVLEILLDGAIQETNGTEKIMEFNEHVKSHLFIDDVLENPESYIFFDLAIKGISSQIKNCKVYVYAICHRDILDGYAKKGYYGNRADILAQTIEKELTNRKNANSFGIGELTLDGVDIYNSKNYYGRILTFDIRAFR